MNNHSNNKTQIQLYYLVDWLNILPQTDGIRKNMPIPRHSTIYLHLDCFTQEVWLSTKNYGTHKEVRGKQQTIKAVKTRLTWFRCWNYLKILNNCDQYVKGSSIIGGQHTWIVKDHTEMETTRKNQMGIIEMRNQVQEMVNAFDTGLSVGWHRLRNNQYT